LASRHHDVPLQVVERVRSKAATYGQDFSTPQQLPKQQQHQNGDSNGSSGQRRLKVAPETIAMLYDKWVMPMTKQVQVRLFNTTGNGFLYTGSDANISLHPSVCKHNVDFECPHKLTAMQFF
jgi:hypothetical protein